MAPAASDDRDAMRRSPVGVPMAAGWMALSGLPLPPAAPDVTVEQGCLLAELALPLGGQAVLLDYRSGDGAVMSLFHDAEMGLALMQRRGDRLVRHVLPGPVPKSGGVARFAYEWCAAGSRWSMTLTFPQGGEGLGAQGRNPLVPRLADLRGLCGGGFPQHPAVLWHGVTQSPAPPVTGAWIGTATPVETARGPVPAGQLRAGERIRTADNGLVPVLGIQRVITPSRGSLAPVLLRAAYFGLAEDVLVSPDQPVWFAGPEAEYLFGEDAVLVPARHLVDGQAALWDDRRSLAVGVVLDLGLPELVLCGSCWLPSRIGPGQTAPRRLLDGYEAVPLVAGLGNGRRAALRG